MDSAFTQQQKIKTFGMSDKEFEHNYQVNVTDKEGGFLLGVLQIGIDDCSLELQAKLDEEYVCLINDHHLLQAFIFPCTGSLTPHYLPVNIQYTIQNAIQNFHIDEWKPSDLEPLYIVHAVHQLTKWLLMVPLIGAQSCMHDKQEVDNGICGQPDHGEFQDRLVCHMERR